LTGKCDQFKSNWFLWSCTATMPDGSEVDGQVQADYQGECIAEDAFEADE